MKLLQTLLMSVLLWFTARRWLFLLMALRPLPSSNNEVPPTVEAWPPVLLLVPSHNERATLPNLLNHLEQLVYPNRNLTIVLLDDGSTDDSAQLMMRWSAQHAHRHLLRLPHNIGKASALNHALAYFPAQPQQIVVIYDADERPMPHAVQWLVAPFTMVKTVGAVSGRRAVSNGLASPVASYVTFENLVHQLVTMRAKARLHLAPALLGANCAYRRAALAQVGNFRAGALLEDSDLTLALSRNGWQIVFEPRAISYHRVPQTIRGYWQQHIRWARGFNDVTTQQGPALLRATELPWPLRLELFSFALGYFDRVALLGGLLLWASQRNRGRGMAAMLLLHLLTPLLQIGAALWLAQAPLLLWGRLLWLPLFFAVDMTMAVVSMGQSLLRWPRQWAAREHLSTEWKGEI